MLLCLELYLEEDVFYSDTDLQDTILQLFKAVKSFRMVRAEQHVNGIDFMCGLMQKMSFNYYRTEDVTHPDV